MTIMDKFVKRIGKLAKHLENAIVIGNGFGNLPALLENFKTVFVIGGNYPETKAKNLVYRQDFNDLSYMNDITAIFIDLDRITDLDHVMHHAVRCKSSVVIEGNDPIGRDLSKPLYANHYECTVLQGFFHVWQRKQ